MRIVFCDIDGTLTINDENIDHCLGTKLSKEDILRIMDPVRIAKLKPNEKYIDLLREYRNQKFVIILLTGRWSYLEPITTSWLYHNKVPYDLLALRKADIWQEKTTDFKLNSLNEYVEACRHSGLQIEMSDIIWIDDDNEMLQLVEDIGCNVIGVSS